MAKSVKDQQDFFAITYWWRAGFLMLPLAGAFAYVLVFVGFPVGLNLVFGPMAMLVILATPIVFYRAGHATLSYLRFGRVSLRLVGDDPRVGGRFAAMLAVPKAAAAAKRVTAELVCIELGRPYDGPSIPRVGEFLPSRIGALQGGLKWSSGPAEFPVRPGLVAGLAAIHFPIPAGLPASDRPEEHRPGRLHHLWELRVDAAVPGPDLSRTFEIKVREAP